jgi:hypothetical protein
MLDLIKYNYGTFSGVTEFLIIFIFSLWLLILFYGKKDINYKRGIIYYIAFIIISVLISAVTILFYLYIIFILLQIGILIWIIVMYYKRRNLDIVHVYFFSFISLIIANVLTIYLQLVITINQVLGNLFKLIVFLVLMILILKKRKSLIKNNYIFLITLTLMSLYILLFILYNFNII